MITRAVGRPTANAPTIVLTIAENDIVFGWASPGNMPVSLSRAQKADAALRRRILVNRFGEE